MGNQLADMTKHLRERLKKDRAWVWGDPHAIKVTLTTVPSTRLIRSDTRNYRLSIVVQQQPKGEIKPVSYNSGSLTPTEQQNFQIEKEALALTWAHEHFSDFLVGLKFTIETASHSSVQLQESGRVATLGATVQNEDDEVSVLHTPRSGETSDSRRCTVKSSSSSRGERSAR